jgi:hypothetical protein
MKTTVVVVLVAQYVATVLVKKVKHVVTQAVLQTVVAVKVNSHVLTVVHMVIVFLNHGSAMVGMTVQVVMMKQIVLRHHVKTKVYGIVAMANVSQHHTFVMDQLILAMQVGVQTVRMVQMKV